MVNKFEVVQYNNTSTETYYLRTVGETFIPQTNKYRK